MGHQSSGCWTNIGLIFLKSHLEYYLPATPRTRKSASHRLGVTEGMQKLGLEKEETKFQVDLVSGPVFYNSGPQPLCHQGPVLL